MTSEKQRIPFTLRPLAAADAIYPIYHCVRIWYEVVLWRGPQINRDMLNRCKILDLVDIPLMECLRHRAINLVLLLYTHDHNIDLCNSMNERTHFLIKIYLSPFILERVDVSVVCERWVERHILRERTSFSHIFFKEPGGCQRLHPLASSSETPLIDCMSLARLPKSDRVVLIT